MHNIKIFNTIKAGAGLGLATSFKTAKELRSDAECLYEHLKRHTSEARSNFTSAPGANQTSTETLPVMRSFSRTSENDGYVSKNESSSPVSCQTVLVEHALQLHAQMCQCALY